MQRPKAMAKVFGINATTKVLTQKKQTKPDKIFQMLLLIPLLGEQPNAAVKFGDTHIIYVTDAVGDTHIYVTDAVKCGDTQT